MDKKVDKLISDVTDIKVELGKNSTRLDNYNTLLAEHIRGVKHLDERLRPIEDHVKFLRTFGLVTVKALAAAGAVAAIVRFAFEFLR